jgi:hypothetical protein
VEGKTGGTPRCESGRIDGGAGGGRRSEIGLLEKVEGGAPVVLSGKGAKQAEDAVRMVRCCWDNRACRCASWNCEWSEGKMQAAASLRGQRVWVGRFDVDALTGSCDRQGTAVETGLWETKAMSERG